jgi:hypothetical protein
MSMLLRPAAPVVPWIKLNQVWQPMAAAQVAQNLLGRRNVETMGGHTLAGHTAPAGSAFRAVGRAIDLFKRMTRSCNSCSECRNLVQGMGCA